MTTVYISSTFSDLKECRDEVYHALRKLRLDVVAMEDYVATDERPLNKCLSDVEACDIYVGIFAWRYGYIPSEGNPDRQSITELEYQTAKAANKPCLVFLLDDQATWLPHLMDTFTGENEQGQHIKMFRQALMRDHTVDWFKSPDNLASIVSISVQKYLHKDPLLEEEEGLYLQLEEYLQASNWKRADEVTSKLMLKLARREKEGWLNLQSLEGFSTQDLIRINQLWLKNSQGLFGFSVQKKIWRSVEDKSSTKRTYRSFGDCVAWRVNNEWIGYQDMAYSLNAPKGHLPILRGQPILLELKPPGNSLVSALTASSIEDAVIRFNSFAEETLRLGLDIASTFINVKPSPSCQKRSSIIISIEDLKMLYSRQDI